VHADRKQSEDQNTKTYIYIYIYIYKQKKGQSFVNCNLTNRENKADSSGLKIVQLNQSHIYTVHHFIIAIPVQRGT